MNYSNLCSIILGLEPQIRGALVYHLSGELLGGGMRDDVVSYLPKEEITRTTINSILRWKSREQLYPFLGKGRYSFTEFEKIKRITFPLTESIFLIVSTEVEVNHDPVIQKILQMIEK